MADVKHGYKAEDDFEARITSLGKRGWFHRFKDQSDLFGRNQRLVMTDPQPADYLVCVDGNLALVEIKATKDPKGFPTSLLKKRKGQVVAATRVTAQSGPYFVAIKAEWTAQWFLVPGKLILDHKGTIPWGDLAVFQWPSGASPCL